MSEPAFNPFNIIRSYEVSASATPPPAPTAPAPVIRLVYAEDIRPGMVIEHVQRSQNLAAGILGVTTTAWLTVLEVREAGGHYSIRCITSDGEQIPIYAPGVFQIRERIAMPESETP